MCCHPLSPRCPHCRSLLPIPTDIRVHRLALCHHHWQLHLCCTGEEDRWGASVCVWPVAQASSTVVSAAAAPAGPHVCAPLPALLLWFPCQRRPCLLSLDTENLVLDLCLRRSRGQRVPAHYLLLLGHPRRRQGVCVGRGHLERRGAARLGLADQQRAFGCGCQNGKGRGLQAYRDAFRGKVQQRCSPAPIEWARAMHAAVGVNVAILFGICMFTRCLAFLAIYVLARLKRL